MRHDAPDSDCIISGLGDDDVLDSCLGQAQDENLGPRRLRDNIGRGR